MRDCDNPPGEQSFVFGNSNKVELNTKEETEIKEVMESMSSTEKEVPGCPGKNIKR